MFRFAFPQMLHALWLIPIFIMGWWWVNRQTQKTLSRFAGPKNMERLLEHNSPARRMAGRLMLMAALFFIIVALAGPQKAMMRSDVPSLGLDIVLLVDTSKSMDARDVAPTRMKRAKRGLLYLIERASGHRIGIIQFAGEAFMSCPFTQDKSALKMIVDALHTKSLPTPGTDLNRGLQAAMDAFERNGAKNNIIVIVTDGESFGADPYALVNKAKKQGCKIYALGVGTPLGVALTEDKKVLTHVDGKPAVSKLNDKMLKKLTAMSGGRYWPLTTMGFEEEALLSELNRLEKVKRFTSGYLAWVPLYPWFAVMALICLVVDMLIGRRRSPFLAWLGRRKKAATLLVVFMSTATAVHAVGYRETMQQGIIAFQENDLPKAERLFNEARKLRTDDAYSEYNLGCVLLAEKKLQQAYHAFVRAKSAGKGNILEDIWYNLGYSAFYLGIKEGAADYWMEALNAYKSILMVNPDDDEARYNTELILREIEKRTQKTAPKQKQTQGTDEGTVEGGGADKPGQERAQSRGRKNNDAPPREEQEESNQRQDEGKRPKTSEQQKGRKSKGMSQDQALRTLKSLEAEEKSIQKNIQNQSGKEDQYQGPGW